MPKINIQGHDYNSNIIYCYIENEEQFWFINNTYNDDEGNDIMVNDKHQSYNVIITEKGKSVLEENINHIYPYKYEGNILYSRGLVPSKCVKIERSSLKAK
jgi:hypothetical protein